MWSMRARVNDYYLCIWRRIHAEYLLLYSQCRRTILVTSCIFPRILDLNLAYLGKSITEAMLLMALPGALSMWSRTLPTLPTTVPPHVVLLPYFYLTLLDYSGNDRLISFTFLNVSSTLSITSSNSMCAARDKDSDLDNIAAAQTVYHLHKILNIEHFEEVSLLTCTI